MGATGLPLHRLGPGLILSPNMGVLKMTTRQILGAMRGAFDTAQIGFLDLRDSDELARQLAGLRNVIVWGRTVTFIVQKLRSQEPDFDEWYLPIQEEMKGDPLLRWFHDLRTALLKEGLPEMRADLYLARDFAAPIAHVALGEDQFGIWVVGPATDVIPNGTFVPREDMTSRNLRAVAIPGLPLPSSHLGENLADHKVIDLCHLYLIYLNERIVEPALGRWGVARRTD